MFGFDFDIVSWIRIPNICCGPDLENNNFPVCPETDRIIALIAPWEIVSWHSPGTFFSVENSFQGYILSWRFMHGNRESGKIIIKKSTKCKLKNSRFGGV